MPSTPFSNVYETKCRCMINSVSYLTQRTDTITIRKESDSVSYTLTEVQHNLIMAIIFLVPVLIIIGIIVWQMSRRKNRIEPKNLSYI